jgi:hypothetical protein
MLSDHILYKKLEEFIMLVSKETLPKLIKDNGDRGIININNTPFEITLAEDGSITFTGVSWSWEKTQVPSAHQDYEIETDDLVKRYVDYKPELMNESQYDFYKDVNELLS